MNVTKAEMEYYKALRGRTIDDVVFTEFEDSGQPLPVLLLRPVKGERVCPEVAVMADPEGNGPGFLAHDLERGRTP